jgi:hypothetical protein
MIASHITQALSDFGAWAWNRHAPAISQSGKITEQTLVGLAGSPTLWTSIFPDFLL